MKADIHEQHGVSTPEGRESCLVFARARDFELKALVVRIGQSRGVCHHFDLMAEPGCLGRQDLCNTLQTADSRVKGAGENADIQASVTVQNGPAGCQGCFF